MNFNLRVNKLRIVFGIGLILVLIATFLLWLDSHRQKAQKSILANISTEADLGVIYLSQLLAIKNSQKLLVMPGGDSVQGWFHLLKSPLEMGIDPTINPILFCNPNDLSFNLAVGITNVNTFEKYLTHIYGNEDSGSIIRKGAFSIFSFTKHRFALIYDADFAIWVSDKADALKIGKGFFEHNDEQKPLILPKKVDENEVITMLMHANRPIFGKFKGLKTVKGVNHIVLTDSCLLVFSDGFKPTIGQRSKAQLQVNSTFTKFAWNKLLLDLWKIKKPNEVLLDGQWLCKWNGTKTKDLVFTSYEFDENFNRIEIKKVVRESHPDISLVFVPMRSTQSDSLQNHLEKARILVKNDIQIGPFMYKISCSEKKWQIGFDSLSLVSKNISFGLQIDVQSLVSDFNTLNFPLGKLDSTIYNHLKTIDVQINESEMWIEIMTLNDCPFHILPILIALNKASF